jgi:hypothetical protein
LVAKLDPDVGRIVEAVQHRPDRRVAEPSVPDRLAISAATERTLRAVFEVKLGGDRRPRHTGHETILHDTASSAHISICGDGTGRT